MPQFRKDRRGSARAAQYSHWLVSSSPRRASYSGDPSVIESPSAATTSESVPRMRFPGDARRLAFALSDHVIAVAPLDDALDVRDLVTRIDREQRGILPQRLVVSDRHGDLLRARRVATLTDELERTAAKPERLREVLDALVHLPEHRLVPADLVRPFVSHRRGS